MIDLVLTIFCSTSIALIIKLSGTQNEKPIALLAANYFVASIISLFYIFYFESRFSIEVMVFGLILGLLFVLSFFAFTKAVSLAGTALATVSSRLSVIVPLIFSIILFNEIPTDNQSFGILLALITIWFFYLSLKNSKNQHQENRQKYLYLIAVLIGIGINDFSMKIFQQTYLELHKPYFLFSIFFSAFLYSMVFIKIYKIKLEKNTIIKGAILGIPNVYSTIFLIGALSQLPGVLVFPLTNIGIIILTAILAGLIFKERLNKYGILSLTLGLISILFLSI
jgi:drug/metabolite transporter (DMT)-like permease